MAPYESGGTSTGQVCEGTACSQITWYRTYGSVTAISSVQRSEKRRTPVRVPWQRERARDADYLLPKLQPFDHLARLAQVAPLSRPRGG